MNSLPLFFGHLYYKTGEKNTIFDKNMDHRMGGGRHFYNSSSTVRVFFFDVTLAAVGPFCMSPSEELCFVKGFSCNANLFARKNILCKVGGVNFRGPFEPETSCINVD